MQWICVLLLCYASAVTSQRSKEAPKDGVSDQSQADGHRLAEDRRGIVSAQPSHNSSVTEERTVTSEQRKDGIHHKVTITKKIRVPFTVHVEKRIPKIIEVPVDKPFNVYVPKPYPVIVEKKVPYEIKVPLPQPYTVEKKVPYPVKVLVDKPYTLHVPKPYPVEVDKKFEYTVEKRVPVEVKVPVERPYPVHVIVEKEVKFPVEKKTPVPVKVPYDKPIPIHVKKHVPVHVDKPVQYTVEKVATYPVKVPFRIPIKVHYPEGGSMEEIYFDMPSMSQVHNPEWSETMASASKAIRGFEQPSIRNPIRHGFSGSTSHRGQHPRTDSHSKQTLSNEIFTRHNHNHKPNPQPSSRPPSYEVNEAQPPSENVKTVPFFSKPDSEVVVPQLIIGNAPQQSTNMLLSQAAIASIVANQNNVFNASNNVATPHDKVQHHKLSRSRLPFTISHTVQHDYPVRTMSVPHQFHNNPRGLQFQDVHFGQSRPTASNHGAQLESKGHYFTSNVLSPPHSSQLPSATFIKPTPTNSSTPNTISLPKWILQTTNDLKNPAASTHDSFDHQRHVGPSTVSHQSFNPKDQSGSSFSHAVPASPNQASFTHHHQGLPSQEAQSPGVSNPSSQGPSISSSFIGSKTFLGDQPFVYTTSIQHNPAPK